MTDIKLTPKQEAFAQKYIELGNAAEAYRVCYDAENMKPVTIRRKAAELLEHGNVSARVRELQERALQRHDVTIDSLTIELEEAREVAKKTNQASAMVSATLGKAKIHGLANEAAVNVNVTNHLPAKDKALLDEYAKAE